MMLNIGKMTKKATVLLHDNLFAFPNGRDVLDDSLFHNNHNSINNDEANVGNNVVYGTIYGAIRDNSDDTNPPPLPPEHPPHPSIMLHDGITNLFGDNETIVFHDCDDILDATQE